MYRPSDGRRHQPQRYPNSRQADHCCQRGHIPGQARRPHPRGSHQLSPWTNGFIIPVLFRQWLARPHTIRRGHCRYRRRWGSFPGHLRSLIFLCRTDKESKGGHQTQGGNEPKSQQWRIRRTAKPKISADTASLQSKHGTRRDGRAAAHVWAAQCHG